MEFTYDNGMMQIYKSFAVCPDKEDVVEIHTCNYQICEDSIIPIGLMTSNKTRKSSCSDSLMHMKVILRKVNLKTYNLNY